MYDEDRDFFYNHIEITIETDNDAFKTYPDLEVARILRSLANDFERGDLFVNDGIIRWARSIHDVNGNKVGLVQFN